MKIAICYFGLSGGKNDKNDPVTNIYPLDTIKKHIINNNVKRGHTFDIFFHTWECKELHKDTLINQYNPVKYIIDKRIKFNDDVKWNYIYSRWYSHSKVITLKKQYEIENNFEYDYVLLLRFDLIFLVNIDFNFSNNYIYAGNWCDASPHIQQEGLIDYWFIANSKHMDIFGTLYDNLDNYKNEYGDTVKSNHTLSKLHLKKNNIDNMIRHILIEVSHFNLDRWKNRYNFNTNWMNKYKKLTHLTDFNKAITIEECVYNFIK